MRGVKYTFFTEVWKYTKTFVVIYYIEFFANVAKNASNIAWGKNPLLTLFIPRKDPAEPPPSFPGNLIRLRKKYTRFIFWKKHGLLPMNLAKMWNTDKSTFLKGI